MLLNIDVSDFCVCRMALRRTRIAACTVRTVVVRLMYEISAIAVTPSSGVSVDMQHCPLLAA